ncbi:MAG: N-6 DNA methylase [Tumebacillaceae bacterium]
MTTKKAPKRRVLIELFRKMGGEMDVWLRVHLLVQAHQKVIGTECSPDNLRAMWDGKLSELREKAPAIDQLLAEFPVRHDVTDDVLEQVCRLYQFTEVPHVGTLYVEVQEQRAIKAKGQVLTPPDAVAQCFQFLKKKPHGRILDLGCGAGDFLLHAYHALRSQRKKLSHETLLQDHLFGLDFDPVILAITRFRLFLECPSSPVLAPNLFHLNLYHLFTHALSQQSFDLVVGNPPWGSSLHAEDKQLIHQHFLPPLTRPRVHNSFIYFLEAGIRLLKDQGHFSFLVPAALLNVEGYQHLRRWLLQHTEIDTLHIAPDLFPAHFAPALFITGKKTNPPAMEHRIRIAPRQSIPQSAFLRDERATFNIHYHPQLEAIFQRMHDRAFYIPPDNFVLGIITGHNDRHIQKLPWHPRCEPIYTARDVQPFCLSPPHHYLLYDSRSLRQAAPLHRYHGDKLLYRFISPDLIAAIDRTDSLTLNSVNCILPDRLPFSLLYLAGLMNSTLLNTYHRYRFFSGKILASHLRTLPFRLPARSEASRIETLVTRLERRSTPSLFAALNRSVYRLYEISPRERRLVEEISGRLRHFPFV